MHFLANHQKSALIGSLLFSMTSVTASAQDGDSMLTAHIDALNGSMPPSFSARSLGELYAENAVSMTPFDDEDGPDQVGRKAIEEGVAFFDEVFLDWMHIEERRIVQGNLAYWEGIAKGTHKDTGKPIEIPITFSFEFDNDGKIISERVYYNPTQFDAQLQ